MTDQTDNELLDDAIRLLQCEGRASQILLDLEKEIAAIRKRHQYSAVGGLPLSYNTEYMQAALLYRQALSLCRRIFDDNNFYKSEPEKEVK